MTYFINKIDFSSPFDSLKDSPKARKKALIIGISKYDDPGVLALPNSANDAEAIHALLESLDYEISSKLTGRVEWKDMRDAIIEFLISEDTTENDTLVYYFSGHSFVDGFGHHYFATSEVNFHRPWTRAIAFDEFAMMVSMCRSKNIVAILDAYYSGGLNILKGCVLASSGEYEVARDSTSHHHGEFTHYILEGLRGVRESIDNEANVTPTSLGWYVYNKMRGSLEDKVPRQTPVIKMQTGIDIVLAHYPELSSEYIFKLLSRGRVSEFNNIHKRHRFSLLDLHRAFIMDADLSGADLHGSDLRDSNFNGTNLSGADMRGSDLRGAKINKADLSGADMRGTDLRLAEMAGTNLSGANLSGALLQGANLRETNLSGAYVVTNLVGILLEGANLRSAYLHGANLRSAQLIRADLRETNLEGVNLTNADLTRTDLRGATNLPISKEECLSRGAII